MHDLIIEGGSVVDGSVLYEHGEHQGPMPGRALRSGEVMV